jgi:hypothetical protein
MSWLACRADLVSLGKSRPIDRVTSQLRHSPCDMPAGTSMEMSIWEYNQS